MICSSYDDLNAGAVANDGEADDGANDANYATDDAPDDGANDEDC